MQIFESVLSEINPNGGFEVMKRNVKGKTQPRNFYRLAFKE